MSQQQRDAVIREAMSWLRTPYHHKASIKGVGVDCAQILAEVYFAAGVIPERPDLGDYPMDWMMHRSEELYLAGLEKYAHEVSQPRPGDVAAFMVGRCFSHGAIVLDAPKIIHAYRPAGVVLFDNMAMNSDLAKRKVKFYSLWSDD